MTTKISASFVGLLLICIFLFGFTHGARKNTVELKADVPQYDDYESQFFYYSGNISYTVVARNHSLTDIYEEGWSLYSFSATTSWGLEGWGGVADLTDGGPGLNFWTYTWSMPEKLSAEYEVEIEMHRPISESRKQPSV
ncbi:hypothetical protein C0J52_17670 [Blattella germanica]|nr:hypothetical protein C0J52_17670 [Blattella germanica]